MRAVILAGGKGTRLKPYTTLVPKPLVPIGEKFSIVEIVIKQLIRHGFTHITLAVNHLSKLIIAYFGNGESYGIKIDYSIEKEELSTVAPLTLIKDLPDNFLVMNGDILSDFDYGFFLKKHIKMNYPVSVGAFKREVKIDFGVLKYDSNNHLTDFEEKPLLNYDVSMGVYCFNKSLIKDLPKNKPYGFDNLMLDLLSKKKIVNIHPFSGFWLDIGRPSDYDYATQNSDIILENLGVK